MAPIARGEANRRRLNALAKPIAMIRGRKRLLDELE
jgi:hypothetical protein